jgi:sec-independent protein translocase protein TatA
MPGPIGPTELVIILAIVLLLFGGSKLPELARSLGKAKKEFRKGIQEAEEEREASKSETEKRESGEGAP